MTGLTSETPVRTGLTSETLARYDQEYVEVLANEEGLQCPLITDRSSLTDSCEKISTERSGDLVENSRAPQILKYNKVELWLKDLDPEKRS